MDIRLAFAGRLPAGGRQKRKPIAAPSNARRSTLEELAEGLFRKSSIPWQICELVMDGAGFECCKWLAINFQREWF